MRHSLPVVSAPLPELVKIKNALPLGTGPYRLVTFVPNEGATYERNPFYHGEPVYFDRIVLLGGGDALAAAQSVLEKGEVDYAWNLQVKPDVLLEMEAKGLGKANTAVVSALVERIVINQTNPDPALGDDRSEYLDGQNPHPFLTFSPITQAMSMAIDRTLIAAQVYGFTAVPECNVVASPLKYISTANQDCLLQDIAGAKQLLDENGVVDSDGDGIREYNGVPLRITYQTTENDIRQATQALIQEWWREIGIETVLIQHDADLFFGGDPAVHEEESYRRFFADVQMYTANSGVDPQQYLSSGLCSNVQTRDNGWSSGNNARMCNAEYDATFALLAQTPIGPERGALVKRLNDIIVQSYYQIPLVNRIRFPLPCIRCTVSASTTGMPRRGISPSGGAKRSQSKGHGLRLEGCTPTDSRLRGTGRICAASSFVERGLVPRPWPDQSLRLPPFVLRAARSPCRSMNGKSRGTTCRASTVLVIAMEHLPRT